MTYTKYECCHVDTCLPDYWGGHHLPHIQIPVWPGMTLKEIKRLLHNELSQGAIAGSDMPGEHEEIEKFWKLVRKFKAAVNRLQPAKKSQRRFFRNIEASEDDDDDTSSVYAYFVFMEAEA